MSSKSERRPAREAVAEYHEARLAELIQRVGDAVDRLRAGELVAFDTDHGFRKVAESGSGGPLTAEPQTRSGTIFTPAPGIKGAERRCAMAFGHL